MVSLEALFLTIIVDAHEGRSVVTFVAPGAYQHVDMIKENRILLKLRGYCFDIMCQVNSEYEQNVSYEDGEKVLYLLVLREIFGCINPALLWFNLFSTTIQDLDFRNKTLLYVCFEQVD